LWGICFVGLSFFKGCRFGVFSLFRLVFISLLLLEGVGSKFSFSYQPRICQTTKKTFVQPFVVFSPPPAYPLSLRRRAIFSLPCLRGVDRALVSGDCLIGTVYAFSFPFPPPLFLRFWSLFFASFYDGPFCSRGICVNFVPLTLPHMRRNDPHRFRDVVAVEQDAILIYLSC